MTAAARNADPLNLVAGSINIGVLDATGFSPRRLAAAVETLLVGFSMQGAVLGEVHRDVSTLPRWMERHEGDLVCCFALEGYGPIRLALPQRFFIRLFERFYGAAIPSDSAIMAGSRAQARFAERLARACAPLAHCGWASLSHVEPQPVEWGFEAGEIAVPDEGVIVIDVPIGGHDGEMVLSMGVPATTVTAMRRRGQSTPARHIATKSARRDILSSRLGHIRLPLRSVLARPEMPASRLLTLKIGDFLPIKMPASVPLLIDRHLIAHGRLGECDGRAAIKIETLGKGPCDE